MTEIVLTGVSRVYHSGGGDVRAVDDATCSIPNGGLTVILGPSGSGKSTMLNLLGGMDSPTAGRLDVDGVNIAGHTPRQLTDFRRAQVGFVFQFYNLIPSLTALENVILGSQFQTATTDPLLVLDQVGLRDRANAFPFEMSGGEMQRVAIARAIAKAPRLLLCDEPTGALDTTTGAGVWQTLQRLSLNPARAVVVVTHNETFTQAAHRIITLRNGRILSVQDNPAPVMMEPLAW